MRKSRQSIYKPRRTLVNAVSTPESPPLIIGEGVRDGFGFGATSLEGEIGNTRDRETAPDEDILRTRRGRDIDAVDDSSVLDSETFTSDCIASGIKVLSHTSKRPRSGSQSTDPSAAAVEPAQKRIRHRPKPRHTLNPATFPKNVVTSAPLSPLFFSNHARQRPPPPLSFSSSEASVTMLKQSREESSAGGITTLKLARGSISQNQNSPTPAVSSSGSSNWIPQRGFSNTIPNSELHLEPEAANVLSGFGIVELLEQDERPTFIIDLVNTSNFSPGPLQIMYANAALRAYDSVLEMVLGKADLDSPGVVVTNNFPEFKTWLLSFVKNYESMDVCLPSFMYGGVAWTCSTLQKRLRVVSGKTESLLAQSGGSDSTHSGSGNLLGAAIPRKYKPPLRSPLQDVMEAPDYFGDVTAASHRIENEQGHITESPVFDENMDVSPDSIPPVAEHIRRHTAPAENSGTMTSVSQLLGELSPQYVSSFDWTRLPLSPTLPRHVQFARSIDWSKTSLGPIESWSYDLRAMANMVMGSPHPAAMYWGDDYIAIYNEAYILLCGNKHPAMMGQSYKVAWAEVWEDYIEGVFRDARESGQATMKDDDCLYITRNGFLEEAYFSWSIVPLVGEDGQIGGLYNPAFEKTRRRVAERRMLTLREVGEKVATAKDLKEFWAQVCKALEYNELDIPFLYLYSVLDETDSDINSMYSGSVVNNPQAILEGSLGVPETHSTRSNPLELKTSTEAWAPYLREAMKTNAPVFHSTEDQKLADLVSGLENRGYGDPCRAVVVCPIYPTTGEGSSVLGFLVLGTNPRRPYDDDYSLFIQLLSRQLATSLASVVLFEEEISRGQRAARLAALDRIELSKQLDLRTQEAQESELKFTRMAEFAPVGMFIANSQGHITYSNDTWFRLLNSADNWGSSVLDEDKAGVDAVWEKIVKDKSPTTHEFRVKTPWQDKNGNRGDTWVLMSAYPEKDPEGGLKSVFGSLTDISTQKFAESFQKRRMEEAMEMKRQQENFIDMTSHEIRNPTSVILQCADEISTTLSEHRDHNQLSPKTKDLIDSSTDAAQTIALCALHQKRIVDDILTLSKLDSALLLVTPVDVQPIVAIQGALNMFKGELDSNDIALEFQVDKSFTDIKVDWVKLDPSRLLQVLINLITNAIKFTHSQPKRSIIVSMGASLSPLSKSDMPKVSYFPTRSQRTDMTSGEDWGTNEAIYLYVAVQDTGQGLDAEEKKLLFNRFSQASPRTHVQYGGSGLGLFISRELTELQGGQIGVASERDVGSLFAFYIKSRRASPPAHAPVTSVTLKRNKAGKAVVESVDKKASVNSLRQKGANSGGAGGPEAPSYRVLVVEDNLVNQRVLEKQLRNLHCTTYLANHGGEALELLKRSTFWKGNEEKAGQENTKGEGRIVELDVVLMDLEMPIMDGLTAARRIRELEADGEVVRHVPIIAVTANARAEQIDMARGAGMDDVVSKPFRIPELMVKIEELIRIQQLQSPLSQEQK